MVEQGTTIKRFEEIEDLITILKDRGCIISDVSSARETLSKINYYRFIAYLCPFKDKKSIEEKYLPKTTFEKIVRLHEFDGKLRSLLLWAIDCIEITLRTQISYTHVKNHNRNPFAYLNPRNLDFERRDNSAKQVANDYCKKCSIPPHQVYTGKGGEMIFKGIEDTTDESLLLCQEKNKDVVYVVPINNKARKFFEEKQEGEKITLKTSHYKNKIIQNEKNKKDFLKKIKKIKKSNKSDPIVKDHKDKYKKNLPLWVIVEFLSLGELSHFYSNLETKDKNEIAHQLITDSNEEKSKYIHTYVESWLHCCSILRNRCAHFGVLYNRPFPSNPRGLKEEYSNISRSLWVLILIIKWLYPFQDKWDKEFIPQMENIVNDYKLEYSDLRYYGFPIRTFKEELKKEKIESLNSWIDFKKIGKRKSVS